MKQERISICVDALFPARALVNLVTHLKEAFPALELRIETDTLAAVGARVARRDCDVGIAGPLVAAESLSLEKVAVGSILLIPVCARSHRLAAERGRIPVSMLRGETQIVLSERDGSTPDQGVLSEQTWRVMDLATKRELILGGLGWGNLPEPMVDDGFARLAIEAWSGEEHRLPLGLVFPPGLRSRTIVRWLLENLPDLCTSWGVGLTR